MLLDLFATNHHSRLPFGLEWFDEDTDISSTGFELMECRADSSLGQAQLAGRLAWPLPPSGEITQRPVRGEEDVDPLLSCQVAACLV